MLALERAVGSKPRAPVPPLVVVLTPRARALQRVVVSMMPRALVQGLRAALGSVLPGPYAAMLACRHRRFRICCVAPTDH